MEVGHFERGLERIPLPLTIENEAGLVKCASEMVIIVSEEYAPARQHMRYAVGEPQ